MLKNKVKETWKGWSQWTGAQSDSDEQIMTEEFSLVNADLVSQADL